MISNFTFSLKVYAIAVIIPHVCLVTWFYPLVTYYIIFAPMATALAFKCSYDWCALEDRMRQLDLEIMENMFERQPEHKEIWRQQYLENARFVDFNKALELHSGLQYPYSP